MSGLSLLFTHGFIFGCTVMVNGKLFDMAPAVPTNYLNANMISHDNYYGGFALAFGEVLFVDKPLIKYRRHGNNVSQQNFKASPADVVKRIFSTKGWSKQGMTYGVVFSQSLYLAKLVRESGLHSKDLDDVEGAIRNGGLTGCMVMMRHKVKGRQSIKTLGMYLTMLTRIYRKYIIE